MREYEVWHDEYKWDDTTNEYWHWIFFMPIDKKDKIIEHLKEIKAKHKTDSNKDVKFAWCLKDFNSINAKIVRNNLCLFSHLLITKESEAKTFITHRTQKDLYEKKLEPFLTLEWLYWCKFVLLHIPDNHENMTNFPLSYADRVETTFRIWFKWWAHFLFWERNPIIIKNFYFDWYEHHWRKIDFSRITKWEFRNYCNICESCSIDDRWMKERSDETKIIISFIDNIVWWLSAILKKKTDSWNVLYWLIPIYQRLKNKQILKNHNWRWYKSINVSKLVIKNWEISFPDFFENTDQISLFDL